VARIVPVISGELDDLVAAGWVKPPTLPRPFPRPTAKVEGKAVTDALIAMREEERW
jgi:hypothetical protein